MLAEPETRWTRAQEHLAQGDLATAATLFKQLVLAGFRPVASLLTLSMIAQRENRFREALDAARSAGKAVLALRRWEALAQVSVRLLTLGDYRRAAELILSADFNNAQVLAHAPGLAQYLGLADQHAAALDRINFAIERLPPDAALHYARAVTLRHVGMLSEACDELERCISLDPDHSQAHWTLAYLRRSAPPGARVQRIEQATSHLSDETEDICRLDYALFKELDDAGNTTQAWDALMRGAARKRATLKHSSAREDIRYAAIARAFSADSVAPPEQMQPDSHRPIFIVGMPRTGTTVLERMLGQHPDVASAGELNDLAVQLCWEADRFIPGMIDEALLANLADIDFGRLGQGFLERTHWRTNGRSCLIDKTPANLLLVGVILKALPDARVLCLQREPMDACFSNLKELFSANNYAYSYVLPELAAEHARTERLVAHWRAISPQRVMRVQYESLVRDPETQARRVLAFCDLPWDARCVDITGNAAPSATASSAQVREPIHDRNVGAWRRYAEQLAPLRDLLDAAHLPDPQVL